MHKVAHVRRVEPLAANWRTSSWRNGTLDTARRDLTPSVEGTIVLPHHLVIVTLSGGSRQLEVQAECGHRYSGRDFAGAVSFIPAGCGRELRMRDVKATWASISLSPELFEDPETGVCRIPAFTNIEAPLISSLVGQLASTSIDETNQCSEYFSAMTTALAHHLSFRYGTQRLPTNTNGRLPTWRLNRIVDYVESHIGDPIYLDDLAKVAGLSPGYLNRALRQATGRTPLEFVNHLRIERARQRLARESQSITDICFELGFSSPSHFCRMFRRATGISPSEYRNGRRKS